MWLWTIYFCKKDGEGCIIIVLNTPFYMLKYSALLLLEQYNYCIFFGNYIVPFTKIHKTTDTSKFQFHCCNKSLHSYLHNSFCKQCLFGPNLLWSFWSIRISSFSLIQPWRITIPLTSFANTYIERKIMSCYLSLYIDCAAIQFGEDKRKTCREHSWTLGDE